MCASGNITRLKTSNLVPFIVSSDGFAEECDDLFQQLELFGRHVRAGHPTQSVVHVQVHHVPLEVVRVLDLRNPVLAHGVLSLDANP